MDYLDQNFPVLVLLLYQAKAAYSDELHEGPHRYLKTHRDLVYQEM